MIKAIITDFDGTLVDTFMANFQAYADVFKKNGITLSQEKYHACFGFRFDAFMDAVGITDATTREQIMNEKAHVYPMYFTYLVPNKTLITFIQKAHFSGVKTAIASTARRENLLNVLQYLNLTDIFDVILAGESVKRGKPDPEIYNTAMSMLNVKPNETLIFEDSEVGLMSALASGANYMAVNNTFFV